MIRIYLYALLSTMSLDTYLRIIYLVHTGYSLYQIGIGYAVFQIANMVSDIPFSYLSDRIGRRIFLFTGAIFKALGALSLLFLDGSQLVYLIIANVLLALSVTISSNVDLAYVNEYSRIKNTEVPYTEIMSRYMSFINAGLIAGNLLGGVLSTLWSFKCLYIVEISISLFTAAYGLFLPLMKSHEPAEDKTEWMVRVKEDISEFFTSWRSLPTSTFFLFVIGASMYWSFSSLISQFAEPFMSSVGLSNVIITSIFTVSTLLSIIGNRLAAKSSRRMPFNRWIVVFPLLYLIPLIIFTSAGFLSTSDRVIGWIIIGIGLFVTKLFSGYNEVAIDGKIIDHAPEKYRATTMSCMESAIALMLALLFPAFGYLGAHHGYLVLFSGLALLFLLLTTFAFIWTRKVNVEKELLSDIDSPSN